MTDQERFDAIDKAWTFSDPAGSERRFIAMAEQALAGGDTETVLQARTQQARTHSIRGQFDHAHAILDAVADAADGAGDVTYARLYLERGRTFNSAGLKDVAVAAFQIALDAAEQSGNDYLTIDAMHMIGIALKGEMSLRWNRRGIERCERTTDVRARSWLGPLYNNAAWTLFDGGQYEEALTIFQKDEVYRRSIGADVQADIARYAQGRTLRAMGRCDEAFEIQAALLASAQSAGRPADGYVHEELAELYMLRNDTAAAATHAAHAYGALSHDRWHVRNEPARLQRLIAIAGPHYGENPTT